MFFLGSGVLYADHGHAQDVLSPSSGAADNPPALMLSQQDEEPLAPPAASSAAEPSLTPEQEGTSEQANMPPATVLFDPGTAQFTQATAILDDVRQKFGSTTERAILLTGHTDPLESGAGANVLSQARALAVGNYLNNAGVPADRIVVRSLGDQTPTADASDCGNLDGEVLARCPAPDRSVEIQVVTSTAEAPLRKSGRDAAVSRDAN